MIIKSDWHLHNECFYDATLSLEEISAKNGKEFQKTHPEVVLGVELTPIEKPEFDYIAKTGTKEGDVAPNMDKPFKIAYALIRNRKFVKCNQGLVISHLASEKFKKQYAEFLRELFEMGISVTFGSDSHKSYNAKGGT